MLDPRAASDMAQSLVNDHAQNGILPQWGYLNLDNYVMVGDPADATIADYYAFGATSLRHLGGPDRTCSARPPRSTGSGRARRWSLSYGYLPADAHVRLLRIPEPGLRPAGVRHGRLRAVQVRRRARRHRRRGRAAEAGRRLGERLRSGQAPVRAAAEERQVHERHHADHVEVLHRGRRGGVPVGRAERLRRPVRQARRCAQGRSRAQAVPVPPGGGRQLRAGHQRVRRRRAVRARLRRRSGRRPAGGRHDQESSVYQPGPDGLRGNDDLGAESSQYIWEMLGFYPENPGSDGLCSPARGSPGPSSSCRQAARSRSARREPPPAGSTSAG